MSEIVFEVKLDETGGYYASAAEQAMFTQGDNFDELLANIREILALYCDVSGHRPEVITLKFHGLVPLAA